MTVTATILPLNVFQMDALGDFCVAKLGKRLPDKLEKCTTGNYAYVVLPFNLFRITSSWIPGWHCGVLHSAHLDTTSSWRIKLSLGLGGLIISFSMYIDE